MALTSAVRLAGSPARSLLFLMALAAVVVSASAISWRKSNFSTYSTSCDFYGNDLAAVRTSGSSNCKYLCHFALDCYHWTYNIGARRCFLKKAFAGRSAAKPYNGATCGYLF